MAKCDNHPTSSTDNIGMDALYRQAVATGFNMTLLKRIVVVLDCNWLNCVPWHCIRHSCTYCGYGQVASP